MAAALIAAPVVTDHPAGASCPAPVLTFKPTKVSRGGTLTITGQHLGDECLDTGTIPQGVGPLGAPLTGLTIVIDQGSNEFVVATGSADSNYSFQVDVVVPPKLEPGEATLAVLSAGDGRLTISPSLVISSAPPVSSADATLRRSARRRRRTPNHLVRIRHPCFPLRSRTNRSRQRRHCQPPRSRTTATTQLCSEPSV